MNKLGTMITIHHNFDPSIFNVHFAIAPSENERDVWDFEDWHVEIEN